MQNLLNLTALDMNVKNTIRITEAKRREILIKNDINMDREINIIILMGYNNKGNCCKHKHYKLQRLKHKTK
jgi:hypothetical protein